MSKNSVRVRSDSQKSHWILPHVKGCCKRKIGQPESPLNSATCQRIMFVQDRLTKNLVFSLWRYNVDKPLLFPLCEQWIKHHWCHHKANSSPVPRGTAGKHINTALLTLNWLQVKVYRKSTVRFYYKVSSVLFCTVITSGWPTIPFINSIINPYKNGNVRRLMFNMTITIVIFSCGHEKHWQHRERVEGFDEVFKTYLSVWHVNGTFVLNALAKTVDLRSGRYSQPLYDKKI